MTHGNGGNGVGTRTIRVPLDLESIIIEILSRVKPAGVKSKKNLARNMLDNHNP